MELKVHYSRHKIPATVPYREADQSVYSTIGLIAFFTRWGRLYIKYLDLSLLCLIGAGVVQSV